MLTFETYDKINANSITVDIEDMKMSVNNRDGQITHIDFAKILRLVESFRELQKKQMQDAALKVTLSDADIKMTDLHHL